MREYDVHIVAGIIEQLLKEIGVDGENAEIKGTPMRVAKMWKELTAGYDETTFDLTAFPTTYTGIVAKAAVPFFSLCAHHMLIYSGQIDFAYMPNTEKLGISKIIRLLQHYSKRLTSQEELTDELCDIFVKLVSCKGCYIRITAFHSCEGVRGVEVPNVPTITDAVRGKFETDEGLKVEAEKMWQRGAELSLRR